MRKQPRPARSALIGEELEVTSARNPANTGLAGTAIDETRNTVIIRTQKGTKRIIKEQATFRINGKETDGKRLIGRIQERIKQ